MSYCTETDLQDRVGSERYLQLADRDSSGAVDPEFVAAVLADVAGTIDSYLASRYALPLSVVPTVLRLAACDLVVERLLLLRGGRLDADTPERQLADSARQLLRDLASRKASIGIPEPAAPGESNDVLIQSGGRVWERSGARGFL